MVDASTRTGRATPVADSVYARFFRDAPDAVIVVDLDGVIVDANDQASVVFGYEPADLLGRPVEDLLPEPLRPRHQRLRSAFLAAPERRPMGTGGDLRARRRDGAEFPVTVSLSPAVTDTGTVVLAAVRDVTLRRTAEDTARRWAAVFEGADWGVVISSADGQRLEQVNPAFARMHGWEVDELTGRPLLDVFAPEVWDTLPEHLARVGIEGHHSFESVHVRRDGTTFPVQVDATAIRDEEGNFRYRAAHVTDLSDRKLTEQAMRESEERFRRVFEGSPFGIALLDGDLRIAHSNEALSTMLGYDADQLRGMTVGDLTPDEDVRRADELASRLFAGELDHFMIEKRLLTARGRVVWAELHVSRLEGTLVRQAIVMAVDVTNRKHLEAELTHLATHDPLTGLPNRTLLEDHLHLAQARTRRTGECYGILFIDLNGFKAVNDRFGHAQGDEALVEVGRRITAAVRPSDTVARVGGDEFAVLCGELDSDLPTARATAVDVARRVIEAVRPDLELRGIKLTLGAAIGILVTGETHGSLPAVLAAADAAMYVAKTKAGEPIAVAGDSG